MTRRELAMTREGLDRSRDRFTHLEDLLGALNLVSCGRVLLEMRSKSSLASMLLWRVTVLVQVLRVGSTSLILGTAGRRTERSSAGAAAAGGGIERSTTRVRGGRVEVLVG